MNDHPYQHHPQQQQHTPSSFCSLNHHSPLVGDGNRRHLLRNNRRKALLLLSLFKNAIIVVLVFVVITTTTTTSLSFVEASSSSYNRRRTMKTKGAQLPKPQNYIVHGLQDIVPEFANFDGTMYAGLIPTTLYNIDDDDAEQQEQSQDNTTNDNNNHNTDDTDKNGELMFWLFAPNQPTYTDTLLIWLNGGPGCSSLGGMMFENGPVTIQRYPAGYYGIDPTVPLQYNRYTWSNVTAIMYVEQPQGGTGFAQHGTIPQNETDVAKDFYIFLQNFYTIFSTSIATTDTNTNHPNWIEKQLFFFGESYAGMFVPSIAHYIYKENKKQQEHTDRDQNDRDGHLHIIPLEGIALGNGWMDAQVQGPTVIDYAWWHGMIDTSTRTALKHEWENCRPSDSTTTTTTPSKQHQHQHHQQHPFHAFTIPDECGIMDAVLDAAGKGIVDWGTPNAYDVTTWDPYLMLDIPTGSIHQFYNNPLVQKALNVHPPRPWVECIPGAGRRRRRRHLQEHYNRDESQQQQHQQQRELTKMKLPGQLLLAHDEPASVVPYVADLLDHAKIRVLIYNGDRDMTTNAQGSELLLDNMVWSGANGWSDTKLFNRGVWLPNIVTGTNHTHQNKLGGYIKQYQNLQFLIVYNSGHLVPFNQDEIAYELVTRFLGNRSFMDKSLPKFHIHRDHTTKSTTTTTTTTSAINDNHRSDNDRSRSYSFVNNGFVYDCISAVVYTFLGFVVGFYVSKTFTKGGSSGYGRRNGGQMYQSIPNV